MHKPWFRMYAEAVDDDKLRLLAFEDRWHFVALLCMKCQGVLDRQAETLDRRIAVKLGVQLRECDEIKRRLMEADLITHSWQPINWESRQYQSDSSTERVKKFREKQKVGKCNDNETLQKRNETLQQRSETVSVTDQNRTEQNRAEQRKEKELASQADKSATKKSDSHREPTPIVTDPPVQESREPIWGDGFDYLIANGGGKEATVRSFLGMLLSKHGKERVTEAVLDTMANDPVEPKAYLRGVLEGAASKARPGNGRAPPTDDRERRIAAALESTPMTRREAEQWVDERDWSAERKSRP